MKSAASRLSSEQQLREMNEALLVSSIRQHELTEQAQESERNALDGERISRDSLDFAESILRTLPIPLLVFDGDLRVLLANQAFYLKFQATPAQTEGCLLYELGNQQWNIPELRRLLDDILPRHSWFEHFEVTHDFEKIGRLTMLLNARRLEVGEGGAEHIVLVIDDITKRKQAEQALHESEDRFRMLADNMSQLAWTCDRLGNVTWYNERWLDYTGLSFDEMKGWDWSKVQHPDHLQRVVERVQQSAATGDTWEDTFPLLGKDGEYRWFLSRAVPIRDDQGDIVRWFGTNTDITDQRRANAEADEANRAKDMFLATLSHEVRTPLSAIVGWMQILQGGMEGGCTEAELKEGLEVIERNARTMVQLLDDVMDVSRIISGKVRLEIRPCELSDVIRAGIDVVRSAARAKDITLSAELDPAASAASCDAARMQQVVWNLISNAIKFTPKEGKVHVKLARDGSDMRIDVTDTGQGIDQELLPYVFDRFRQADSSTRRRSGGLGLGLSIVKHLVELHGGTVQAQSEGEGRGSTFTVLLPIRAVRTDESGDDPEADESEPSSKTGRPLVRLDGLRILVVDDEPDARRLLVRVLQEAGAVISATASAAEAIEALEKSRPEVLVSDLGMPDEDGYDLIRQIRAHGHHAKDLPAVALSAFVHKSDQRKSLLAGFQMHVAKPADPHDLTAVIASLAGRDSPAT